MNIWKTRYPNSHTEFTGAKEHCQIFDGTCNVSIISKKN